MNINSVFERMAEELAIKRGITEDILSWKCRIAYSVTAKRGLDALWEQDVGEQHGTVSLSHLMGTMKQVLRTFYVLCPDIEASIQNFIQDPILLGKEPEALLGKLLQEGGCFYHVSYRAAPSPFVKAQLAGVTFLRGVPLGAARCMSSQYVGMSDIAKMLDCPRAALAGKLYIPEYRITDEALKHKITFHRGHWFERGCSSGSRRIWLISPLSTGNRDQIRGCAHQGSSGFHAGDRSTTTDSTDSGSQIHSKATDNPF